MTSRLAVVVTSCFSFVAAGVWASSDGDHDRSSRLVPPDGASSPDARGEVELGRFAFVVEVEGLPEGEYTVCLDDGSGTLAPIGSIAVTAEDDDDDDEGHDGDDDDDDDDDDDGDGDGGSADGDHEGDGDGDDDDDEGPDTEGSLRLSGESLPFGATSPLDLAGRAISIKAADGMVVLQGNTPSPIVEEPDEREGRCPLARPEPPVDPDAEGVLKLESGEGRIVIKVRVSNLEPATVYDIIFTNPADSMSETIGMITTNDEGAGKFKIDTEHGDPVPFGAADLAALEGFGVTVRAPDGGVVLTGTVCKAEVDDEDDDDDHDGDDDDHDGDDDDEECEADLTRAETSPDADAEGEVEIESDELEVEVEHLDDGTYEVFLIDPAPGGAAESIGTLTPEDGRGEVELKAEDGTTLPFGKTSIAELVNFIVEVRAADGAVVLRGTVPATVCEDEDDDDDHEGDGDDDDDEHEEDEECEADLTRADTSPDPDAEGEAEIEGDELEVEVEKLADGTYEVFLIDPAPGGAAESIGMVTPEDGHGELEFEAEEGVPLPFGKTSVAEFVNFIVEVRAADGAVVLQGTLPATVCEEEDDDDEHDGDDGHDGDDDDEHDGDDGDEHDGEGSPDGSGALVPPAAESMFLLEGEFDAPFLRGDSNGDGTLNITDPLNALQYLFSGGTRPYCLDASDANDDGEINISDAISLLGYLFLGDGRPGAPGTMIPGSDPTVDRLYCEEETTL